MKIAPFRFPLNLVELALSSTTFNLKRFIVRKYIFKHCSRIAASSKCHFTQLYPNTMELRSLLEKGQRMKGHF